MPKEVLVFDEINITPLTDVFLVLLIIMMVVAPMMFQQRADVEPPDITSGQKVDHAKLIVEVTANGDFYVMGVPTDGGNLTTVLTENLERVEDKNVVIRADKNTKSRAILTVFEAARDAKYEKVTVAGKPLGEDRQSVLDSGNAAEPVLEGG